MNMDEVNKFIALEAEAEFLKLLSKPVGKERGFFCLQGKMGIC